MAAKKKERKSPLPSPPSLWGGGCLQLMGTLGNEKKGRFGGFFFFLTPVFFSFGVCVKALNRSPLLRSIWVQLPVYEWQNKGGVSLGFPPPPPMRAPRAPQRERERVYCNAITNNNKLLLFFPPTWGGFRLEEGANVF